MFASVALAQPSRLRVLGGYGLPRSLLAAATLSVLGFNPPGILFAPTPADPSGMRCDGVAGAGLWCLVGDSPQSQAVLRWLALVVLAVCVSGWRPSWLCLPQWYITASLAMALPAPSGADYVAQIMAMLLVLLALGDRRRWHWGPPRLAPHWTGAAAAALLAVRVQLSIVYLAATAAKLAQSEWRDGSALPAALLNPSFGVSDGLACLVRSLVGTPASAVATWTVLGLEASLGVLVLAPMAYRRLAIALGVALHGVIAVLLGLPVFGLVMIAAVILSAASSSAGPRPAGQPQVPLLKESGDVLARTAD
ncbi:sporulation-delaying protein SdpB family protein [Micromonospora violae]|uniref:sporulation-delaying protein SdpB family protein n=1 Tax=Micromonospora violae TaxID=1278207 RepID=UPI00340EB2BF